MAREIILSADKTLYSPAEPEGRLFGAGEQWPGDAWTEKPGGEPEDVAGKTEALKDLVKAREEVERLTAVVAAGDHDRGKIADEREAALSKVAGLTQRALDAEKAQAEAEARHLETAAQRDQASIEAQNERQRTARVKEALDESRATIERLTAELATAQQAAVDQQADRTRIMELETDLANARAEVAKVDGDKDGKVGGSRKGGL